MSGTSYGAGLAEFWLEQGKALLKAQELATRSMSEGMQALMAGKLPALPGAAPSTFAADMAQASDAMLKLWSSAASASSELAGTLEKHVGGKPDGVLASVFERITDPRQWLAGTSELDDVLARMAEGPRLADLWNVERRFAQVLQAWLQVRRCGIDHQRIVLEAWMQAGRRLTEELAGRASADGRPLELKQAFALWTEIANRQLLETQRSEPFLHSQREMIRASTELRLAQRDLVEHFGKQYGFPTRTELDDVHRTLTDMRRELRRMRRALQDKETPSQGE